MTLKQQPQALINVPARFSLVEPGVYRSASPTAAQVPFLASLGLRTIVSLTTEHPTKDLVSYARASGVDFFHLGNTLFQPLTDWKPINDEIVKTALEMILDVRTHPILVLDPVGIHQTGVVLGCLRIMQRWNFASALSEYRSHSGPTKHRYADETYIECLPSWWVEPEVDDYDDEWVEADPPPKEKKDKKKKEKEKEKDKEKEKEKDKEKEKKKEKEEAEKGEDSDDKDRAEKDKADERVLGIEKVIEEIVHQEMGEFDKDQGRENGQTAGDTNGSAGGAG